MAEPAEEVEPDGIEVAISPVRRGRKLGRYILCYELASGGMATVYLARASGAAGFEKLFAVKIIHPHLAKEQGFVEMFLDEARIAALINHPNVCSVFDFGKADGTYFLAMEYLVGESAASLARMLAKDPPGVDTARLPALIGHVFQQACEGLHAAHELEGEDGEPLSVVHRDVTPQNLFIGYDGSVRVVDFGVASAVGRLHHTTTGILKGKHAYMSPEQVRQKPLDRRSDVWSLGVTLWEMLTRRRLFRRDGEYETLEAVVRSPIPSPSEVRPQIPIEIDAVVRRALQRNPDDRYPTAREMGRDLGRAVAAAGGASSADVADLMDLLYADRRKERAALLDRARKMDVDSPSSSKVLPAPIVGRLDSSDASMPSRTMTARAKPAWRKLAAVAGAALLAGFIGTALVVWAPFSEPDSAAPTAQADPPAPTSPPAMATDAPPPSQADPPEAEPNVAPDPATEVEPAPDDPDPDPDAPAMEGVEAPGRPGRRRAPRSPAAPAATGRGTLNVVTPPGWADIEVDGRRVGRSPTEIGLAAGTHRVRLLPYGEGPPIQRRVTVVDGETARLSVRLPE